jgi:Flp pilus assembly pilin Flp
MNRVQRLRPFRAISDAPGRDLDDDGSTATRGQGLAEYALILALIAIVAIIALIFLGGQISKILSSTGGSL